MKHVCILLLLGLLACQNTRQGNTKYDGPLKPFFLYWDELANTQFNLDEKQKTHTLALGKNDKQAIDIALKDFENAHSKIIEAISSRYPSGSVKLPLDQPTTELGNITNLRITGYQFPWNTATRLSYHLSFDFEKKHSNPLAMVRFEFLDKDGDLFMSSNITVKESGTYTFEIRPEIEFYRFEKAIATFN